MKRRFLKFTLLLIVPLALYAYAAERNSWRSKVIALGVSLNRMEFSPDRRYLLVTTHNWDCTMAPSPCYAVSNDATLWNVSTLQPAGTLKEESGSPLLVNYAGKLAVLSTRNSRKVRLLSFPDLKLVKQLPSSDAYWDVTWPDIKTVAWCSSKGIKLKNISNGVTRVINLSLSPAEYHEFIFSFLPDGKTIAAQEVPLNNEDQSYRKIEFWDIVTKKRRFSINHKGWLQQPLSASRTGLCVILNEAGSVEIWNYFTGKRTLTIRKRQCDSPVISPDGTIIAAVETETRSVVTLWNTFNGQPLPDIKCAHDGVQSLIFSPDSKTLACGSGGGGFIQLWRVK